MPSVRSPRKSRFDGARIDRELLEHSAAVQVEQPECGGAPTRAIAENVRAAWRDIGELRLCDAEIKHLHLTGRQIVSAKIVAVGQHKRTAVRHPAERSGWEVPGH